MRNVAAAPCIALDPDRHSADIQSFEAQSAVGGCFDVGILVSPLLFGVGIVTHGAQKLFGWFRGYGFRGTAFFEGLAGAGVTFAAVSGFLQIPGKTSYDSTTSIEPDSSSA
jgi:hypothetical protein